MNFFTKKIIAILGVCLLSAVACFSMTKDEAYVELGIKQTATEKEIKKAYHKLALVWHPDKLAGKSEEEKKAAEEKFKNIQKAYETLTTEAPAVEESLMASSDDDLNKASYENVTLLLGKPNYNNIFSLLSRRPSFASSITTLDFTKFKKLEEVVFNEVENLQEIIYPKDPLTNLSALTLGNAQISDFDVTPFPVLKKLNLSFCDKLQSLTGTSDNLEEIDASFSSIETIDLSQFTALKKLKLSSCINFKSLTGTSDNLEKIDLSSSGIETIDLSQFTALKKLKLSSCNNFKSLTGSYDNLEKIDLSSSGIETIDLSQFTALKKLKLSSCINFKSLTGTSDNLEEIDLSRSGIETIDLSEFQNLKKLNLFACDKLTKITVNKELKNITGIRHASQLSSVSAEDGEILYSYQNTESLPDGFSLSIDATYFPELQSIQLECEQKKSRWYRSESLTINNPEEVKNLTFLQCSPKNFPVIFSGSSLDLSIFPNLKTFVLRHNSSLTSLSGKAADNLESLDLSGSDITSLDLLNFPKLKILNLRSCARISSLSSKAEKLETLDLSKSGITNLNLSNFPELKTANLSSCKELPSLSGKAEKLETLDLSKSGITNLDLSNFPELKTLNLDNCTELKNILFPIESLKSVTEINLLNCPAKFDFSKIEGENVTNVSFNYDTQRTLDLSSFQNLESCFIKLQCGYISLQKGSIKARIQPDDLDEYPELKKFDPSLISDKTWKITVWNTNEIVMTKKMENLIRFELLNTPVTFIDLSMASDMLFVPVVIPNYPNPISRVILQNPHTLKKVLLPASISDENKAFLEKQNSSIKFERAGKKIDPLAQQLNILKDSLQTLRNKLDSLRGELERLKAAL